MTSTPSTEDDARFWLRDKNEILYVLRAMQAQRASLEIRPADGSHACLSLLLAVGDDHLVLDPPMGTAERQWLLAARRLSCRGRHDQVSVRFELGPLRERPDKTFTAPLPEALWRQQRREFYRLSTSRARPLLCHLPLPEGGSTAAPLLDLSGGGLAIIAPPTDRVLTPGMRLAPCRLELPEVGQIEATLEVRSTHELTLKNGQRVQRVGCAFVDLPDTQQTLIQRYIIKVERERKARACGLM